jgi:hypothetical protein
MSREPRAVSHEPCAVSREPINEENRMPDTHSKKRRLTELVSCAG